MSDKEHPNEISVKTATINESHAHVSSVIEAVDAIKLKIATQIRENCKTGARHPMIKVLKKKSPRQNEFHKTNKKNFLKQQRDAGSRVGSEEPSTKAD